MRAIRNLVLAWVIWLLVSGCAVISGWPAATVDYAISTLELEATAQPQISEHADIGLLEIYYLDVGQGDSTLLKGPDFTFLIDAGRHDRKDVLPYLEELGVESIDLLIGTHPHADHIGQMDKVIQKYAVGEVWMSGDETTSAVFERVLDAILASDAGYHEPAVGEVYDIGSAHIEVVSPTKLSGDLNDDSISVRVQFGDVVLLFTGDAERHAESEMVNSGQDLRAHVLQLGHHGSSTSSTSEFLDAVQPWVTIWSAGVDNSYGHPHAEVTDRLAGMHVPTFGTANLGTIRVTTDGYTIEVFAGDTDMSPLFSADVANGE